MTQSNGTGCFSGSTLKWTAIAAMFINHFGDIVLKGIILNAPYSAFTDEQFSVISGCFSIFHAIGRISMPIFCFLIVEGFLHTHNVKKYVIRLILFAVLSEIPYNLAFGTSVFDLSAQNVFFTLGSGLLTLVLVKRYRAHKIAALVIVVMMTLLAYFLKFDGSYYGILMIVIFYLLRDRRHAKCLAVIGLQLLIMVIFRESFDLNQLFAASSLILIYFYNGRRGMNLKYFFYGFYPLHLLLLALVTKFAVIPMYV